MSALKLLFLGSCTLALVLMFSPDAKVSEMDQKVIGTFNAPVMIPGQILPPGTYVFKVLDVVGSRGRCTEFRRPTNRGFLRLHLQFRATERIRGIKRSSSSKSAVPIRPKLSKLGSIRDTAMGTNSFIRKPSLLRRSAAE